MLIEQFAVRVAWAMLMVMKGSVVTTSFWSLPAGDDQSLSDPPAEPLNTIHGGLWYFRGRSWSICGFFIDTQGQINQNGVWFIPGERTT